MKSLIFGAFTLLVSAAGFATDRLNVGAVVIVNHQNFLGERLGPFRDSVNLSADSNGFDLVTATEAGLLDMVLIHNHFWTTAGIGSPESIGLDGGSQIFANGLSLFGPPNSPIAAALRETTDPVRAIKLIVDAQIPFVFNTAPHVADAVAVWYKKATGGDVPADLPRAQGPDAIRKANELGGFTFFAINAYMVRSGGPSSGLVPFAIRSARGLRQLSAYVYQGERRAAAQELRDYLTGGDFQGQVDRFRYDQLAQIGDFQIFFSNRHIASEWRLTLNDPAARRRFTFQPVLVNGTWQTDDQGNVLVEAESDHPGKGVMPCRPTQGREYSCDGDGTGGVGAVTLALDTLTGTIHRGFTVGTFRIGRGPWNLESDDR